jgi:hypothetical protein
MGLNPPSLLVALVMGSGVMENMSLVHPISVSNVNSLAFPMTQLVLTRASTSPTTTTSRSKRLAPMFLTRSIPSPILLSMTISCRTSSWPATRSQLQCRSTRSQLSWVVVTSWPVHRLVRARQAVSCSQFCPKHSFMVRPQCHSNLPLGSATSLGNARHIPRLSFLHQLVSLSLRSMTSLASSLIALGFVHVWCTVVRISDLNFVRSNVVAISWWRLLVVLSTSLSVVVSHCP